MKYQVLYDYTMENGGATIRIKDYPAKLVMPTKGFVTDYAGINPVKVPRNEELLEQFDIAVERILNAAKKIGVPYLGTWVENADIIEVAAVEVFKNKEFTIGYALANKQKSIYDLKNKKEIYLW